MLQSQYQPEERARLRKQWVEQAIAQALASQWEEAIATNKQILNLFSNDVEAYNRLGKAYSEVGQYAEAKSAYSQTLKLDPNNSIAQRNLERLSRLSDEQAGSGPGLERIDPRLFIEETGKTAATSLLNLAPADEVAKLTAGDQVRLAPEGRRLLVQTARGTYIGQVEPRLGNRVINLMETGNQYAAAITAIESGQVKIIIRETYQHPSQLGKVSFPAQGGSGEPVRAYIKDSVLRYDREDDEDLGDDSEYGDGEAEAEELSDAEFEDTDLGEL
jgi:tetratricopeptide (TPR) repeat protein